MRSKGAIKFFAIALALVCIFQLSFTVVTHFVENNASEYAENFVEKNKGKENLTDADETSQSVFRKKKREYLDSVAHEPVYNILVKDYTYMEAKERELNLGLDLQGGMHVILEVSTADLLRELAKDNPDESFIKAIKAAKENSSQQDFITAFYDEITKINPNVQLKSFFATSENKDNVTFESTNEQVLRWLRSEADQALDRTFNILRTRVDQFGVTQPNIQKQEGTGRIIVELPGVDDQERVRALLQTTAELEFWETFENAEVLPAFEAVNKIIRKKLQLESGDSLQAPEENNSIEDEFFSENDRDEETVDDAIIKSPGSEVDSSLIAGENQDSGTTDLLTEMTGDSAVSDSAGTLSPEEFKKENPLYALLTPALIQNAQGQATGYRPGPVVGYSFGKDTATINNYLKLDKVKAVLPPNIKFAWSAKPIDEKETVFELVALKVSTRNGQAPLSGDVITNARVDISQQGSREVSISMNTEGARVWKRLTGANIDKSIAITLDGKVYSYPTVNNEISGGNSVIQGRFTTNEAKDLSTVLESGKLPMMVDIIEEAVIGPSLGKEAIQAGLLSLMAGLVLVLLFMIFYYNHGGLVANLALIANLFFIVGILASLGAALTLPGMAGILLTIGMSVDANVLIYERIREELAAGKGLRLAIADGYKNAYSSIIDANLTTLLTGIILYTFGSGPIHGFAIILIIGILTSLFSAIFITRIIFDWALDKEKVLSYSNSLTSNAFRGLNFQFLKNRKTGYIISSIILIAGMASLLTQGLEMGVDFKGGYSYVVRFDKPVEVSNIRGALEDDFGGAPEVKTFGPSNQVKITTDYLINEEGEGVAAKVENALEAGLSELGGNFEVMSSNKVGPTIAEDIKTSAVWAVIFSLIVIFLYIFLRFRKWQYGLGALMALFHDVLIVLSLFSIFRNIMPFSLEIDQAFIAAILTVVGYSINDTVVVFDRIREKLTLHKKTPLLSTMNTALNETLSRTLITSATTFLVIIILFIFGGEIIRGFSFALLIGILVGTYSSLFIASPIVVDFTKKSLTREQEKE